MLVDSWLRDFRYAARALARAPLFTAIAVATFALGIGANTAVFSVVDNVLLKPLPYPNADELVSVRLSTLDAPGVPGEPGSLALSASMYFTFAEENRTFEHFGVWGPARAVVTGVAEPEEVDAVLVSAGVLEALGVQPVLGRQLSQDDQVPAGAASIMLGYEYWQRRFGGDPAVIGRAITVMGVDREIVGVLPRGFRIADTGMDLVAPFAFDRSRLMLPTFDYRGIARLRPGATLAEANADIERMLPIWLRSWPPYPGTEASDYEGLITPALRPLKDDVVGGVGEMLWILMGTIGVVLLIACVNVTNLLLIRVEGRQHDLAVRAALGAGGWRIGRQLLAESLLLALCGGALAAALAVGGLEIFRALAPNTLPRVAEIALDARALAFMLLLSLLAGLAAGAIPALRHARGRPSAALRAAGRTASASRERHRVQNALVPDPDRVLQMLHAILDARATLPGVQSVGFTSSMPLEGFDFAANAIAVEGRPAEETAGAWREFKFLSPGLLATAGARIVAGRDFTWTDLYEERPVAMVSESLARELWGTPEAAIGSRINQGTGVWREVIGVVQDVRDDGLSEPAPALVYWPPRMRDYWLDSNFVQRAVTVALRTERAGTAALMREIQQAVWSVNASLPVGSLRTMQDVFGRSLARTTFTLLMLCTAGALALLLGVVGLYGVVAYGVSQRRREIAIRGALGERAPALVRRFVRHGLTLAAAGVALGLGAAAAAAQLMTSLLFSVTPLDPATYVGVALVLAAAAALASYVPARRAARVHPMQALREE